MPIGSEAVIVLKYDGGKQLYSSGGVSFAI